VRASALDADARLAGGYRLTTRRSLIRSDFSPYSDNPILSRLSTMMIAAHGPANTWRRAEAWYRNLTPCGGRDGGLLRPAWRTTSRSTGRLGAANVPSRCNCIASNSPTPLPGKQQTSAWGGCYVKLLFPLPVGTKVDVRIALPDGEAKAKGVVRTLDPTLGNGIEFTEMEHASQEALELCLHEFPESTSGDFEIIR